MQEGVLDTGSDINCVITAIGLDIRAGEGISNLKAVFTLTTKERRLNSRTCQADRVVVLVAVQLDAGQSIGIELKAVRTSTTFQGGANSNSWNLGIRKKGVVPATANEGGTSELRADAVSTSTSAN